MDDCKVFSKYFVNAAGFLDTTVLFTATCLTNVKNCVIETMHADGKG